MTTDETAAGEGGVRLLLGLSWPARVSPAQKRSLVAGGLGWMLDAMDVMLYSMVLAELLAHLGISKAQAGFLNSLTLAASAVGGMAFGMVADRLGRTRALMASILVYSVASFACGLSQTLTQLAACRLVLGLGMGGEWTTGAALIAETWPPEHRGKALGLMQSTWAIGEMIAAAVTLVVLPRFGWRAVFFVGVLPALVVLWIRREVQESPIWLERGNPHGASLAAMWRPDIRGKAVVATLMNAFGMFGYWGLFTWIPGYLALPEAQGGRGLGIVASLTWVLFMAPGKWLGYTLFGFAADAVGRRRSYVVYLLAAAALVPVFGSAQSLAWLLVLGPFVGFFGTGFFSGFSAVASELFPTEIRATAMGLTYNVGRGFSALAPFAVGWVATRHSFFAAFLLLAAAFLVAAALALLLPETKGKHLE
ncbi:MAG TPA: MFS transporter [Vicinamibacteria bacterium]|nr:MFS transporter [Vicinamibacteria bacterium]